MTAASALALYLLLAQIAPAAAGVAEEAGEHAPVLPVTLERVSFRPPKKMGVRKSGFLTVTRDELWFSGDKKATAIALDRIQLVSFGKMKGNVDTDWAVLAIGEPGLEELVGFGDARKFGDPARTREIYDVIKMAVKEASAAQYRVPPGFRTYDKVDRQCTLAIPESWGYHLESVVVVGDRAPWGTILFTSEPIRRSGEGASASKPRVDEGVLERVLAGEIPAFFLERTPVEGGMGCKGFSDKARAKLIERAREDPLFGEEVELPEPSTSDVSIDDCAGLRIEARGPGPDGGERLLDLSAVAHKDTLFLFGLRAAAGNYETFREPYETAIATVRFSVAR